MIGLSCFQSATKLYLVKQLEKDLVFTQLLKKTGLINSCLCVKGILEGKKNIYVFFNWYFVNFRKINAKFSKVHLISFDYLYFFSKRNAYFVCWKANGLSLGCIKKLLLWGFPGWGSNKVCKSKDVMLFTARQLVLILSWSSSFPSISSMGVALRTPSKAIQVSSNCCREIQPQEKK